MTDWSKIIGQGNDDLLSSTTILQNCDRQLNRLLDERLLNNMFQELSVVMSNYNHLTKEKRKEHYDSMRKSLERLSEVRPVIPAGVDGKITFKEYREHSKALRDIENQLYEMISSTQVLKSAQHKPPPGFCIKDVLKKFWNKFKGASRVTGK